MHAIALNATIRCTRGTRFMNRSCLIRSPLHRSDCVAVAAREPTLRGSMSLARWSLRLIDQRASAKFVRRWLLRLQCWHCDFVTQGDGGAPAVQERRRLRQQPKTIGIVSVVCQWPSCRGAAFLAASRRMPRVSWFETAQARLLTTRVMRSYHTALSKTRETGPARHAAARRWVHNAETAPKPARSRSRLQAGPAPCRHIDAHRCRRRDGGS